VELYCNLALEDINLLLRIGGRPGESRADSEIPLLGLCFSNLCRLETPVETVLGGQFDWGGRFGKSNRSVQRLACLGWKPRLKYKGISQLDCETDRSSKCESRS